eukprot:c7031_g1_i1.p1 GENE.c7031_g1_i1~~c7031_g1_i1.p1  ORF type:complete len:545 (+),score=149.93 c7031_g1_i1:32-1666(+)
MGVCVVLAIVGLSFAVQQSNDSAIAVNDEKSLLLGSHMAAAMEFARTALMRVQATNISSTPHHHHHHHHHRSSSQNDSSNQVSDDSGGDGAEPNESDTEDSFDPINVVSPAIPQKDLEGYHSHIMGMGTRPVEPYKKTDISTLQSAAAGVPAIIGGLVNARRNRLNEMIKKIVPLNIYEREWWLKFLKSKSKWKKEFQFQPESEFEKAHLYFETIDGSKDWKTKREWKAEYEEYQAAQQRQDMILSRVLQSKLMDKYRGGLAADPNFYKSFNLQFRSILLGIYLHGYDVSPQERIEAEIDATTERMGTSGVSVTDMASMSQGQLLQHGLTALAKASPEDIAKGIGALKDGMGKLFPIPDSEASARALKEWVRPKYIAFKDVDGCPHYAFSGDILLLRSGRYDGESPMQKGAGPSQLCWMCRGVITLIQEMVATDMVGWAQQTDVINHALTVVCDRIAELNSSPHWQTDCKNLVEYWGPEMLCRLEHTTDEAIKPVPVNEKFTSGEVEVNDNYDIQGSFTQLSLDVCVAMQFEMEKKLFSFCVAP